MERFLNAERENFEKKVWKSRKAGSIGKLLIEKFIAIALNDKINFQVNSHKKREMDVNGNFWYQFFSSGE